ncbi:hypothetical protein E1I69_21850 [Bacillus timonensis]|uniref:Uncharacterized protein n=1 Tax=Bacillus timonensis TaxID=1033734 RepID=A0A4S3PJM2_9BACI|nr:hypothetical protein [Bacillus timonensis]THE09569.1 hypothetical protein E1I69_21850 [Bacillus timonensis]
MKKLVHSEWKLSVMALQALLGTFIAIFVVQRELNLTFAIGYLIVFAVVVAGNAIYVLYKRKKNNGRGNENQNHE